MREADPAVDTTGAVGAQHQSLWRLVGRLADLLQPIERRRFVLLGLLSSANALLEAVAAIFILAIASSLADSRSQHDPVTRVAVFFFPDSPHKRTFAIASATLLFYLVKNASGALEQYIQQRMVHRTAARASSEVVAAYLRVPMSFHYTQSSGRILRDAWSAVDAVFRLALLSVLGIMSEALAALALLAVLLFVAPFVSLGVLVGLGGLVGLIYRALRSRMRAWGASMQELSEASMHAIEQAFGAIREARLLGREEHFVRRYETSRLELARSYWRAGTAIGVPRYVLELAFVVAMVGTVLALTATGASTATSVSLLGLYAYAGLRLMPSANRMVIAMNNLRAGEAGIDVMIDALNVPQESPDASEEDVPFGRAITLEHVSYRYDTSPHDALSDVSLTISKGERVGVVGPSGAGKSTLVDILVGLLTPTTGRVLVDGTDISDRRRSWRRRIGYASQAVLLLDDSLRANVAFGLPSDEVDEELLRRAIERAQLRDVVDELVQGDRAQMGDRGVRLSGGQRQRVSVARALYGDPDVLVLDEATAALDQRTEAQLTEAVMTAAQEKTLIVIAHRLTTVRNCDRIIYMADGKVADVGSFNDLVERNESFRNFVSSGSAG